MSHWMKLAQVALLVVAAGCTRNQPPETPGRPVGPGKVAVGDTAEFRLTSRDPEGYSVSFRCSWDEGDTSGWSLWVGSGETLGFSQVWRRAGTYAVAAQARDPQEALSGWSEALEVLVGNQPRRPTRPAGPITGWIDTSYSYTTVSTDPEYDEIRYAFDWGDGTVETTGFRRAGDYVSLAHVWTRPDTFGLTVRAIDRPGFASAWSETLRVAMRDINGPGIPLWHYELGPGIRVTGVPALDGGRVLFGATDGVLRCLDTDGSLAWEYATGGPIWSAPAIAADGAVVFGSSDGRVYCLSSAGARRWDFATGGEVQSAPAIAADGAVIIGSDDGRLYCIEPDGSLRWSRETGGPVRSSPAVGAGGAIYFGSGDSFVYALGPDGAIAWRYQTGGAVDASPALGGDGTVYVTGRDGWLYALRPNGTLGWRERIGEETVSSPVVGSDGSIFTGTETGRLMAFDPGGELAWVSELPAAVRTSPLLDSELIVTVGAGRRLVAVDAWSAGRIVWDLVLPGTITASSAVDDNGVIYTGDSAGNFWAIRGLNGLDTGAWPKLRRDARNTGRAGAR